MGNLWRGTVASLDRLWVDHARSEGLPWRPRGQVLRGSLLILSALVFAAHVSILRFANFQSSGSLLSNLTQIGLALLVILAMLDAGRRSGRFGRRTWFLAALAVGFYTVGQAIFTYSYGYLHSRQYAAPVYDPIFFFWIVPLVAAALADPAEISEGFDWSSILDFSLLVLLALAVHFALFTEAARLEPRTPEMLLWRLKIRLIRDLVVLSCLWGRVFVSDSRQVRALFLRLGVFYTSYALSNAVYLYFVETTHLAQPDTWIDVVWSIPRMLAILVALSWNWPEEIPSHRQPSAKWRRYLLDPAPLVVPLLVVAISSRMFSSAPWTWGCLIGATLGIVSLRLRLTELRQHRALAGLHTSNNLLHSIIEGTSEAVYLKDSGGRYLLMNSAGARLLGYTPEEIVGKTDHDIFPANEAEMIVKRDQEVMQSGQTVTAEDSLTSAGSPRTYLSTKNAYRDEQGRVVGVLGISVDVTERRRMEEHLRQSQRIQSIGTFSSGIAHDFNNILTVINGYSYLVHANAEEHPAIRESVDQINKATERASTLIDQLLAFSRQQILQPRVISLNDVVSNLLKMLNRLMGEDVLIRTRLAADLGAVQADPGQIEQVLMNLAANSRDAMLIGGTLRLETSNLIVSPGISNSDLDVPPGSYVLLTVSDTGVGMDAETKARIFDPFFTTKPVGKGTGLGLATVYGIVEQSGGHLAVESSLGTGTTFKIYLPRINAPTEPLTHIPSLSTPQRRGHQTILLVDDNPQLRELTHEILSASGFTVLSAASGEQAEHLAKTYPGPIDLLLTDVVMPVISGRETASRVCKERTQIQVLYMSGYPDDTIAHHGILDPGICFLQKPFSPEQLVEKIREVLSIRAASAAVPAPSGRQSAHAAPRGPKMAPPA